MRSTGLGLMAAGAVVAGGAVVSWMWGRIDLFGDAEEARGMSRASTSRPSRTMWQFQAWMLEVGWAVLLSIAAGGLLLIGFVLWSIGGFVSS